MPGLWRGKGNEAASFLSWLVTAESVKIKCQVYASVADGLRGELEFEAGV